MLHSGRTQRTLAEKASFLSLLGILFTFWACHPLLTLWSFSVTVPVFRVRTPTTRTEEEMSTPSISVYYSFSLFPLSACVMALLVSTLFFFADDCCGRLTLKAFKSTLRTSCCMQFRVISHFSHTLVYIATFDSSLCVCVCVCVFLHPFVAVVFMN